MVISKQNRGVLPRVPIPFNADYFAARKRFIDRHRPMGAQTGRADTTIIKAAASNRMRAHPVTFCTLPMMVHAGSAAGRTGG